MFPHRNPRQTPTFHSGETPRVVRVGERGLRLARVAAEDVPPGAGHAGHALLAGALGGQAADQEHRLPRRQERPRRPQRGEREQEEQRGRRRRCGLRARREGQGRGRQGQGQEGGEGRVIGMSRSESVLTHPFLLQFNSAGLGDIPGDIILVRKNQESPFPLGYHDNKNFLSLPTSFQCSQCDIPT